MRRYSFDELLVAPGLERLTGAIRHAEASANDGRARGAVDASLMVRWWRGLQARAPDWLACTYQWAEGRATPTLRTFREGVAVVGCCWWSAPSGQLHARVVSDVLFAGTVLRLRLKLRHWGLTDAELLRTHPAAFVYPELYVSEPKRHEQSKGAGFARCLSVWPLDAEAWAIWGDWCEDAGDEAGRLRCREAVALLGSLSLDAAD